MHDAPLLTTLEIAEVLRVHPKHVYRLLRQGLPGRRLGGQWRFAVHDVQAWMEARAGAFARREPTRQTSAERLRSGRPPAARKDAERSPAIGLAPPLLVANGDVAVEALLGLLNAQGAAPVGLVPGDSGTGFARLRAGDVLVAGTHGGQHVAPGYVRIDLAEREVGLAARSRKETLLGELSRVRLGARPKTAPVRAYLEQAIRRAGASPAKVLRRAPTFESHRDLVLALVRGDIDVGVTTRAWAARAGLSFRSLVTETYGLLVRLETMNDPVVARMFETVQSAANRRLVRGLAGYDAAPLGRVVLGASDASSA